MRMQLLTVIFGAAVSSGWLGVSRPLTDGLGPAKAPVISFFEWFGELGIFCGRLFRATFALPFEGEELVRQMDAIGAKSLPLVALAGAATGVVSLCTQNVLRAAVSMSWWIIVCAGPSVRATARSGSWPTANTSDCPRVVDSESRTTLSSRARRYQRHQRTRRR